MMDLGATILKNRADELEAKRIGSSMDAMRKTRHDYEFRAEFHRHIDKLLAEIEAAVLAGQEPPHKRIKHKFAPYDFTIAGEGAEKGLKSDFDLSTHPLHVAWESFREAYRKKGVDLVINAQHDGVGMESWYELSVQPIMVGTRDGLEYAGNRRK